jgi:hypothetical protein
VDHIDAWRFDRQRDGRVGARREKPALRFRSRGVFAVIVRRDAGASAPRWIMFHGGGGPCVRNAGETAFGAEGSMPFRFSVAVTGIERIGKRKTAAVIPRTCELVRRISPPARKKVPKDIRMAIGEYR